LRDIASNSTSPRTRSTRTASWRVVTRYAELSGGQPQIPSPAMYAVFDGLFQQALLRRLAGEESAAADLQAAVTQILSHLIH
jgi:hypothetical protein